MGYFTTRYAAQKAYPNAMIRKCTNGRYIAFNDYTTYEQWKAGGLVK